jgi:cell division protein FtsI/penicillin-binding protein 2
MLISGLPWRRGLPEDDPDLAGLVADLRAMHRAPAPGSLQQPPAFIRKHEEPRIPGTIVLAYNRGRGTENAGSGRRPQARWGMVASVMLVLGLVTGTLLLSDHPANQRQSILGARGPASGIPQDAQVTLTIDSYVQEHIVVPELTSLIRQFDAKSGAIVVERPSDGAILALASQPSRDARSWQQVAGRQAFSTFPNAASSNAYTPGETMMALMTAIGFDTGSFDERTQVTDSGLLKADGITIVDWCWPQCAFGGPETVGQMLYWASSVTSAEFSHMIPEPQLYQYLQGFGFGARQVGPGLPNASAGTLIEPYVTVRGKQVPNPLWRPGYRDATALGGTGITATPVQLANAYAVLANGGRLMQPHLVQSYTLDGKTSVVQPKVLHVVFQQSDTARRVTNVLVRSQVHGEACLALVPGYDVAAKTGAAVSYNWPKTMATTVAYGPVGETDAAHRFVVLVELQLPNVPWGSETAAPATSRILRQLFQHYGLQPDPKHIQPSTECAGPNE